MTQDPQNPGNPNNLGQPGQPNAAPAPEQQQDVFANPAEVAPVPQNPPPQQQALEPQNPAPAVDAQPAVIENNNPVPPAPEEAAPLAPEALEQLEPAPVEEEAPVEEKKEDEAPVDPFLKKDDDGEEKKVADKMVPAGEPVHLEKLSPGLKELTIGLGWDAPEKTEEVYDVDLDASFFVIGSTGMVRSDNDFVFYNNLSIENGSITHSGDNPDGVGEGDDEQLDLLLEKMPFDIDKIYMAVSIHNAEERFQDFTIVENAHVRCVNKGQNEEIIRFDIPKANPKAKAYVVGELSRDMVEGWVFTPYSVDFENGLYGIARHFGVNVLEP